MRAWQEMAQRAGQGDSKEVRGLILYLVCLAEGLYWDKDEEAAKALHRLLKGMEGRGLDILSWLQIRAEAEGNNLETQESCLALALIYGYGLLGILDLKEAKSCLDKITDSSLFGPVHYFYAVFLELEPDSTFHEILEKYQESLKYWDSPQVQYRLARYLFHNLQSDEDLKQCLDYAHLAAVNGHEKACELLGGLYEQAGEIVSAWAWYWIAIQKGNESVREVWLSLEDRLSSAQRVHAKLLVEEFLSA